MTNDDRFFLWVLIVLIAAACSLGIGFAVGCSATMRAGVDVAEGRVHVRLSVYCLRDLLWGTLLIAVLCACLHQQAQLSRWRDAYEATHWQAVDALVRGHRHDNRLREIEADATVDKQLIHGLIRDHEERLQRFEAADKQTISF